MRFGLPQSATLAALAIACIATCGCGCQRQAPSTSATSEAAQRPKSAAAAAPVAARVERPQPPETDDTRAARKRMVKEQLSDRDIDDRHVLAAMSRVQRHRLVPEGMRKHAYNDHPLPIGHRQTISQPYIVALMTQMVRARPGEKALDVGTGSGYQAAVLAEIVGSVQSIEIVCPLADRAQRDLAAMGYKNITVRCGDGYRGLPEHAPFDVIILAAAPDHVPQALIDQLAPGGRLVLPVGGRMQQKLVLIERDRNGKVHRKPGIPVMFVPMTGEALR